MKKTVVEIIADMGYQPKEGLTILVKIFSEDLIQQAVDFVWSHYHVLQICEEKILLLPVSDWGNLKKEVHRTIRFDDIIDIIVEPYMMNHKITIETKDDTLILTTQQKELSDLRFSGLIALGIGSGGKNWHGENLDGTLEVLKTIGQED